MKVSFWVRLALGLLVIALLLFLGYRLLNGILDFAVKIPEDGGLVEGEEIYEMETPEPMPTMPAYMMEDSFYDNAGSVDGE